MAKIVAEVNYRGMRLVVRGIETVVCSEITEIIVIPQNRKSARGLPNSMHLFSDHQISEIDDLWEGAVQEKYSI